MILSLGPGFTILLHIFHIILGFILLNAGRHCALLLFMDLRVIDIYGLPQDFFFGNPFSSEAAPFQTMSEWLILQRF